MALHSHKSVMIIAGSDPSAGAGIFADIRTMTSHNIYAIGALTCLTSQSSQRLYEVKPVDEGFLKSQLNSASELINIDAIKIGVIASKGQILIIKEFLKTYDNIFKVIDPVMSASVGGKLNENLQLKDYFLLAGKKTILTPNLSEARELTGIDITNISKMQQAAKLIYAKGFAGVLIKGGNFVQQDKVASDFVASDFVTSNLVTSDKIIDLYWDGKKSHIFSHKKLFLKASETHGTGCCLASALAANLTKGLKINEAIQRAIDFVQVAIAKRIVFTKGAKVLNQIQNNDES